MWSGLLRRNDGFQSPFDRYQGTRQARIWGNCSVKIVIHLAWRKLLAIIALYQWRRRKITLPKRPRPNTAQAVWRKPSGRAGSSARDRAGIGLLLLTKNP